MEKVKKEKHERQKKNSLICLVFFNRLVRHRTGSAADRFFFIFIYALVNLISMDEREFENEQLTRGGEKKIIFRFDIKCFNERKQIRPLVYTDKVIDPQLK